MIDRKSFRLGFVLTALTITSLLFVRALYIQYPVEFSDEAHYALEAKFLNNPRFASTMPNILYFYVYHPTSWFGVNHLAAAKLFNAVFFGLSMFPLYGTSRCFLSKSGAFIFSVLIVLSPISSYSVYVMPESMYFFVFWILAYVVVVRMPLKPVLGGISAGALLAALSAIKPHAVVLVVTVPIVLLTLYFRKSEEKISLNQLAGAILSYFAALVVARLIINYMVRGDLFVSLFGSYYQEVFTPSMRPKHVLLSRELWYSLRGHLSYLAVLFWPAVAFAIWPSATPVRNNRDESYAALLSFSTAALLILIAMAAKYTADVTSAGGPTQACRLDGRYYDFALGMLVLLFLARTSLSSFAPRRTNLFRFVLVGVAMVSAAAAWFAFADYCPNSVDFPEVVTFSMFRAGLALVILGSFGSTLCLAFFPPAAARLVYLGFLGTLALTTSAAVFVGQILYASSPRDADLAGIAVRNLVPDQIDQGIVFARTQDARSYRALFQLYSLSEQKILDQPTLTANDIPPARKWALLLDPYTLHLPYYAAVRGKGFEFVQFAPGGITVTGGSNGSSPRR